MGFRSRLKKAFGLDKKEEENESPDEENTPSESEIIKIQEIHDEKIPPETEVIDNPSETEINAIDDNEDKSINEEDKIITEPSKNTTISLKNSLSKDEKLELLFDKLEILKKRLDDIDCEKKPEYVKTKLFPSEIIFICSTGTAMSPAAEAIFNSLSNNIHAVSASLNVPSGVPVQEDMKTLFKSKYLDLSDYTTTNIQDYLLTDSNIILTNNTMVRDKLKIEYNFQYVYTIKEFSGDYMNMDIRDPFGGDFLAYEKLYNELYESIEKITDNFKSMYGDEKDVLVKVENTENFTYLEELIKNGADEIILDCDIYLEEDEILRYDKGIRLDRDGIVINGANHVINARGKTGIFECVGKDITLKNITMADAYSENGGAVSNFGDLTIENVIFKGCSSNKGSAICNFSSLSVEKSHFTKNSAFGESGGALYNHKEAAMKVSQCCFDENMSDFFKTHDDLDSGAAITNNGNMDILDSCFNNNTTNGKGGAINNNGIISIGKCKFKANTSQIMGAVLNNSMYCKMFDCEIIKNKSSNIISNSDFLLIFDSLFSQNDSNQIILNMDKSRAGIHYVKFIGNQTDDAVIVNKAKSCTVEKCTFEDNLKTDASKNINNTSQMTLINLKIKDEGPSIDNDGYILIKKPPYNLADKIEGSGSVENGIKIPKDEKCDFGHLDRIIHQSKSDEIHLKENIQLENYEIDYYEGGIELDRDNLTIDGKGFTIDGRDKSRIFIITGKNITLKNITFKGGNTYKNYDNLLNNHGGALRINKDNDVKIENCKFIKNASEDGGGAIDNKGTLEISATSFIKNNANRGGTIYNQNNAMLIIEGGGFKDNSTKHYGGAIHNNKGILYLKNADFISNYSVNGGAITNTQGVLMTEDSTFDANTAKYGGSISNTMGMMNIENSFFESNKTEENGGAIDNSNDLEFETEICITDSTFKSNESRKGGAINNSNSSLNIENSFFESNKTEEYGGAIYNKNSRLNIEKTDFKSNKANARYAKGGAIWCDRLDNVFLPDCTYEDNHPDDIYSK